MTSHLRRFALAAVIVYLIWTLPEWAARYTWSVVVITLCGVVALSIIAASAFRER